MSRGAPIVGACTLLLSIGIAVALRSGDGEGVTFDPPVARETPAPTWSDADAAAAVEACASGDLAALQSAIHAGVPVDTRGLTPLAIGQLQEPLLSIAARAGHVEIVRYLLSQGARVNAERVTSGAESPFSFRSEEGTALHRAALGGHFEVVKLLVESGADTNSFGDGIGLEPPLHSAMYHDPAIAKYLVENGADISLVSPGCGHTPLILAIMSGNLEVVQLLLDRGADVNQRNRFGQRPIEVAIESFDIISNYDDTYHRPRNDRQIAIIQLLLARGADVQKRDAQGRSLVGRVEQRFGRPGLAPAYAERRRQIVTLLEERGAPE